MCSELENSNSGGLMVCGINTKDFIIWLIETQFWIKILLKIKVYLDLRTPVVEISLAFKMI